MNGGRPAASHSGYLTGVLGGVGCSAVLGIAGLLLALIYGSMFIPQFGYEFEGVEVLPTGLIAGMVAGAFVGTWWPLRRQRRSGALLLAVGMAIASGAVWYLLLGSWLRW